MNRALSLPALAVLALLSSSCVGPRASAPAAAPATAATAPAATRPAEAAAATPATAVVSIPVSGMHCGNCVQRVTNALLSVDGVVSAQTLLSEERAVVTYAPARVQPAAFVAAIRELGYTPGAPVAQ